MGAVTARVRDSAGHSAQATVPYAVTAPMPIGSSNVDNATELSAYTGRYGPLQVRRSYDQPGQFGGSGIPATWSQTSAAALPGSWAHVHSFKGNVPQTATGQHDARLAGLVASIPQDGRLRWLILWHEPEGEIRSGAFTAAQFYAAQVRFRDILAAAARPDLTQMVCFGGDGCFTGVLPFTADDLVPPGVHACFDAYNRYPTSPWRELSERFALQVAWAHARGKRWGLAETGCYEHPDGPHRKTAWTTAGVAWARAQGAEFFTYWDNAIDTDPNPLLRRLHSTPEHIAAWRALTEV